MPNSNRSTLAQTAHQSQAAHIQRNLELIQSALCEQALQCRSNRAAADRLLSAAGDIERISEEIGRAS